MFFFLNKKNERKRWRKSRRRVNKIEYNSKKFKQCFWKVETALCPLYCTRVPVLVRKYLLYSLLVQNYILYNVMYTVLDTGVSVHCVHCTRKEYVYTVHCSSTRLSVYCTMYNVLVQEYVYTVHCTSKRVSVYCTLY